MTTLKTIRVRVEIPIFKSEVGVNDRSELIVRLICVFISRHYQKEVHESLRRR